MVFHIGLYHKNVTGCSDRSLSYFVTMVVPIGLYHIVSLVVHIGLFHIMSLVVHIGLYHIMSLWLFR